MWFLSMVCSLNGCGTVDNLTLTEDCTNVKVWSHSSGLKLLEAL